jgi:hypothetical protein
MLSVVASWRPAFTGAFAVSSSRLLRKGVPAAAGVCRSVGGVVSTVKSKLKPTLLANWTVWPLAHVINFALVPPAQRILYINVVNVSGCRVVVANKSSTVPRVQPVHCPHVIWVVVLRAAL